MNQKKSKLPKILVILASLISLFSASCGKSTVDETFPSVQNPTTQPETASPSVTPEAEPSIENNPQTQETPAEETVETPEQNLPETLETTIETPTETTQSPPNQTTQNQEQSDRPVIPTKNPAIQVGKFEFQLQKFSIKKEFVDRTTNKRFSTANTKNPSSYLFVELDLTNNSDEPTVDLFRYQLDCGDGEIVESAADAAVAYRSNEKIDLFAAIQSGTSGKVSEVFLVPESCLNSDGARLVVFSKGAGKGIIPLDFQ